MGIVAELECSDIRVRLSVLAVVSLTLLIYPFSCDLNAITIESNYRRLLRVAIEFVTNP
jgi:hypothetical protein